MIIIITDKTLERLSRPLFHGLNKLDGIRQAQEKTMTKVSELVDGLNVIDEKITKIGSETSQAITKIAELQDLLANQDVPQEVLDKVNAISDHLTAVDNLIPDASPAAA